MYFNTRQLLKYKPLDALLIVINQSENLRLNPKQIRVTQIEGIEGTKTLVRLESFSADNAAMDDFYRESGLFTYDRINIADVFNDGHFVNLKLPTTTHDLLDVLERDTGIIFDKGDLPLESIWSENYILKPRDNSLRWVGSVRLTIGSVVECIQLSSVLTANVLNDLRYPAAAIRLSDYLLNNVLDDLHYPVTNNLSDAFNNNILNDLHYPDWDLNTLSSAFNNNVLPDLDYPEILKPCPPPARQRIFLKDAFLGSII